MYVNTIILEERTASIFLNFNPENEDMFLQNGGICLQRDTELQPRRSTSTLSLPWELQISQIYAFFMPHLVLWKLICFRYLRAIPVPNFIEVNFSIIIKLSFCAHFNKIYTILSAICC
jgi:hypothetical protein